MVVAKVPALHTPTTTPKPIEHKPLAPSKPAPSKPAPSKPAPSKPAPSNPAPSKPAPKVIPSVHKSTYSQQTTVGRDRGSISVNRVTPGYYGTIGSKPTIATHPEIDNQLHHEQEGPVRQSAYRPRPKPVVLRGEEQLSPQIFPERRPSQGPSPSVQSQSAVVPTPSYRKPSHPQSVASFGSIFQPYSKCASALVCTAENYCNSIGVISEQPVEISPFRVPLTDCIIEGTGEPGKCCRDPNYVDPWPVNLAGVCAKRTKVCHTH